MYNIFSMLHRYSAVMVGVVVVVMRCWLGWWWWWYSERYNIWVWEKSVCLHTYRAHLLLRRNMGWLQVRARMKRKLLMERANCFDGRVVRRSGGGAEWFQYTDDMMRVCCVLRTNEHTLALCHRIYACGNIHISLYVPTTESEGMAFWERNAHTHTHSTVPTVWCR